MYEMKQLAIEIFKMHGTKPCKCEAEHEVCLDCDKCHVKGEKQIAKDFKHLNHYIDHTILKAGVQTSEVTELCHEAIKHKFKTVCIHPAFIKTAKQLHKHLAICTVVGFPLGANAPSVKFHEAQAAINAGVNEIDMVINIGNLKEKSYQSVYDEISNIARICKYEKVILKVIIETCLLTKDEIIKACLIAKKAGADFVKTSTGFSTKGAEVETVKLIRQVVGAYMGVKAAGGIKTKEDAVAMLRAGANRIGSSNSVQIVGV
jgi:deoxyribose-phosphate aldolase